MNQALNNPAAEAKKIFQALFDPTESICQVNELHKTSIIPLEEATQNKQFFTINPVKNGRKDTDITSFRNVLVEFDDDTLDAQKNIIAKSGIPYTSLTFSGKKSIHMIISLETPLTSRAEYDSLVAKIYAQFPSADPACKNPNRFSRTPGAIRLDTNRLQEPIELRSRVPNSELIAWLASKEANVPMLHTAQKGAAVSLKKGRLTWATRQFLQHQAPPGEWHAAFYKVCRDFNENLYSIEEAQSILEHMPVGPNFTGVLDANDLKDLRSAYSKEPRYAPRGSDDKRVVVSRKSGGLSEVIEVLNAEFASKVLVYTDSQGNDTLLALDSPTICRAITLKSLLPQATQALLEAGYDSQSDQVEKLLRTWKDRLTAQNRIDKLPPSFTLDHTKLSFNYIDIAPTPGPTPTWDGFIARCGQNGEALMAYYWSIFLPDIQTKQYLILSDGGHTGKSCLIRHAEKVIGPRGTTALSTKDQHWPAACIGKRLGIFPEVNNTAVVMSEDFKAITGNDTLTITRKYQDAYSAKLDTKFIITSNSGVHVDGRNANKERCILVTIEKFTEEIEDFEQKLADETPGFLFKCKTAFEKLYNPKKKSIECGYELFEDHVAETESDLESAVEKLFKYEAGAFVTASKVTDAIDVHCRIPFFRKRLVEYLERRPGVKKCRIDNVRGWQGLKLRATP